MVKSQFLYLYTDELVRHHLVDWVEGPLSVVPAPLNRDQRGFQKAVGDLSADTRTRAGEAYNLGLLTGPLVSPRGGNPGVPLAWQDVIKGRLPLTRLGKYAYLIGRALRDDSEDIRLASALDLLACAQILHIGFETDGRWYSTVLLFEFAREQLESCLGRQLDELEVRYLAGAVINTLDNERRGLLLDPYRAGEDIEEVLFEFEGGGFREFNLEDLPDIASEQVVGINAIRRKKAALYWAQPDRGIYSRARRSPGFGFVRALLSVDQALVQAGEPNPLTKMLSTIENSEENRGIFAAADRAFSDDATLYEEWQQFEQRLFDAVNGAADASDIDAVPRVWLEIQRTLRGARLRPARAPIIAAPGPAGPAGAIPPDLEGAAPAHAVVPAPLPAPEAGAEVTPLEEVPEATPPEDVTLQPDDFAQYLDESYHSILVSPPPASPAPAGAVAITAKHLDLATNEAKNRELGCNGELFVVEFERRRLIAAGRADLAEQIKWVSKEVGDGLGYDVTSFTEQGQQLKIEVKTTNAGQGAPFYISANELDVWRTEEESYRLYRVFNFAKEPKIFVLEGNPDEVLKLEPITYRARL